MAGKHELEKFEYLFVDIEWNQTPGTNGIEDREPIQIGVVATDESMNLKKSFSRAMLLSKSLQADAALYSMGTSEIQDRQKWLK